MSTTNRGVAGPSPSGFFYRKACGACGRVVAHSYVTGLPHAAHKPRGLPCWGTAEAKAEVKRRVAATHAELVRSGVVDE